MSESYDDDVGGPATRRIRYLAPEARVARGDIGVSQSTLSETDIRSEAERARRLLGQSAVAFRDTLANTARDVVLAARGLTACIGRWVEAERVERAPRGRKHDT
jgi:hypothetical protein